MVSVVCPIYNEEKYIAKCIDSVLEQGYPKEDLEVLFVDGMSNDGTREIVADYAQRYPLVRLVDNPQRTVPPAMNLGIKAAKGDTIIRLDAHCEYPKDYFSVLVKALHALPNAENVGAVCETLPCNETGEAYAIAEVLSSSFGMGNSYFRTGATEVMEVDTVPFGCFKRDLFERIGYYDEDMIRNQDDELNGRIINAGGSIYLLPYLKVKYFARDKVSKVRRMFYQYGLYKPLGNKKLGSPATVRQFFPLLFLLGIVFGGILSSFVTWIRWIYFAVLALYLAIGIYCGAKSARRTGRLALICWMPYIFLNVHLSYGWGYLVGLYRVWRGKEFNVMANR